MLRIGYVRLRDPTAQEDTALLKAAGCQVVRAEEPGAAGQTLNTILDFIGAGDQLVVRRLDRLGLTGRGLLEAIERLAPAAATHEIFALRRAGVGPVEIARRLGVSRMTVWRKLKAVESAGA